MLLLIDINNIQNVSELNRNLFLDFYLVFYPTRILRFQMEKNETKQAYKMAQLRKKKTQFDSLFDPQMHLSLLARGERRFSLKALQGALMITLYSAEPRFHIPHSLLIALMDIDSLMTKWRCKYI